MNRIRRGLFVIMVMLCVVMSMSGCGKSKAVKGKAQQPKDVVATVDGKVITLQDINEKIEKLPAYYQGMFENRKKELLDDMILEMVLYGEAKNRGIDKDVEIADLLKEAHKRILVSKLIKDEVEDKSEITEEEVKKYYDSNKDKFNAPEQWRASHILVDTEDEAKAILEEIRNGASFEELAKTKSKDTSASKGGDVGYFTKGQMVPEFEMAASGLEVGGISEPVKTQFGFHIVKLTDKKEPQSQELSQVEEKVRMELLGKKRQELFSELTESLRAAASIEINEELLTK